MKILKIQWLEESTQEAVLLAQDSDAEFPVFSYPCRWQVGQEITNHLFSEGTENIYRIAPTKSGVQRLDENFEVHVKGRVKSTTPPLIELNHGCIELDRPLPGDILVGDWVEFQASRLDA